MKRATHEFFKVLDDLRKFKSKNLDLFIRSGNFSKRKFYACLKEAHPFVFSKSVVDDKLTAAEDISDLGNAVKDFAIPHKKSLYLLNNPSPIVSPDKETGTEVWFKFYGYLISEITPETFEVFIIGRISMEEMSGNNYPPWIDHIIIDLKDLRLCTHDYLLLKHLTNAISVKRRGIERQVTNIYRDEFSQTKYTKVKYDNVIHIADKEEYYYSPLAEDSEISFEYAGFWRGHWRAFYLNDSIIDGKGRRIVDYSRTGKDRVGNYNTPGYTWVTEHIKGDPALAEIKTHLVKAE